MKRCPNCNRTYTDEALNFCLEDGTPLGNIAAPIDSSETMRYGAPRDTNPPPTEIYRAAPASPTPPPVANRAPHFQPQWSPMSIAQPRKSHAVWWVLGGLAVVVVLGIGIVVILLAVASINSQSNSNSNRLTNTNTTNRNLNSNRWGNANSSRGNTNSTTPLPAAFSDDFSEQKWTVSSSAVGDLWYTNDEYHMRSKDQTYVVIYAPSDDYNTENATVRVTTRNVDGISPAHGYGLIVHAERSKDEKLEDYSFLIFTGPEPKYKVLMHKAGTETPLVPWTASNTIRKGTGTNQLEVRIKGGQLGFYINGQYITSVTDTANYKRGRAGLYTSDDHEIAFDDLEITR
jgi:hypothetical protein